ncbi:MAG: hypothetical protein ACLT2Z_09530 [Eubacterium sp.]
MQIFLMTATRISKQDLVKDIGAITDYNMDLVDNYLSVYPDN